MPHFVTDIRHADSARRVSTARGATNGRAARDLSLALAIARAE